MKHSKTHVYDWSKSFKEGQTRVENMAKTTSFAGKVIVSFFWDFQGILFIDFLTVQ
jgi:hypothetical protein